MVFQHLHNALLILGDHDSNRIVKCHLPLLHVSTDAERSNNCGRRPFLSFVISNSHSDLQSHRKSHHTRLVDLLHQERFAPHFFTSAIRTRRNPVFVQISGKTSCMADFCSALPQRSQ